MLWTLQMVYIYAVDLAWDNYVVQLGQVLTFRHKYCEWYTVDPVQEGRSSYSQIQVLWTLNDPGGKSSKMFR